MLALRLRAGASGSVTIEVAVLGPVLLLVVFAIVQAGLWSYARSLALGAAQTGVAAGRAYGAPPQAGRQAAEDFLAHHARDSLTAPQAVATTRGDEVQVVVRGRSLSVLPGLPGIPVTQHAVGPVEQIVAP